MWSFWLRISDYKFKTFIPYYQETKNEKKGLYINAHSAGTGNIESPENYVAIIYLNEYQNWKATRLN